MVNLEKFVVLSREQILSNVKTTVSDIRNLVTDVIKEQKISASPAYLKKERVREELQAVIASRVASGLVNDDEDLQGLIADMNLALNALKTIPFGVWQRIAKK